MYEKNISEERKKYLRQINRNKVLIVLTRLAIVILFIAVWEILANVGIIDSFIASSPSRIWNTFLNLSSSDLMTHVGITCLETLIGFTLGTLLGIAIAIVLWWSKFLSRVLEPFLVILSCFGSSYYYMGRSWNASNYNNGTSNITNSNSYGDFKWIFGNR